MVNCGIMGTEALKRAQAKYDAHRTVQIKMKLNIRTDGDIRAHLDAQSNKQGYLKELIREDIERRGQSVDRHKVEYRKGVGKGTVQYPKGVDQMLCTIGDIELYAETEPVNKLSSFDILKTEIIYQAEKHGIRVEELDFGGI